MTDKEKLIKEQNLPVAEEILSGNYIRVIVNGVSSLIDVDDFKTFFDTSYAAAIIESLNNEIETGDWTDDTGTSGFWYADISNVNITADSVVDVIPEKAYKSIVDAAAFAGETDSSSGSVRIYAENQPTGTIEVTLNIHN